MTRIKQARTRKAGYTGSMNIQDFPPTVSTPAQRRVNVRYAADWFITMLDTWGTDTKIQRAAKAAAELVILEASE